MVHSWCEKRDVNTTLTLPAGRGADITCGSWCWHYLRVVVLTLPAGRGADITCGSWCWHYLRVVVLTLPAGRGADITCGSWCWHYLRVVGWHYLRVVVSQIHGKLIVCWSVHSFRLMPKTKLLTKVRSIHTKAQAVMSSVSLSWRHHGGKIKIALAWQAKVFCCSRMHF